MVAKILFYFSSTHCFDRKWPAPVSLGPVQKEAPEGFQASMPVWDPQDNPRDAKHLMPILTPAYPASKSFSMSNFNSLLLF